MFCFCLTTWGWFAWNAFLDGVFEKFPSGPYAIRDGFTQTWGRDPTWWSTLFLVLSFLGLLEVVGKVILRHVSIASICQWPPWQARESKDNPEEWSLEMWQEMEQDPAMKARLRRMARDDHGDEDADDDEDAMMEEILDISTEKKSYLKGHVAKLKQMIPMRARRG